MTTSMELSGTLALRCLSPPWASADHTPSHQEMGEWQMVRCNRRRRTADRESMRESNYLPARDADCEVPALVPRLLINRIGGWVPYLVVNNG